jgi:thioredoxin-disulfide reductase
MEDKVYKVLIVGSGPAGFTAAIYACRANLEPVLYEGIQPGGQLTETTRIENFPGYPDGVTGNDLMEDLRKQATRLGTDIRFGIVTKADFSKHPFELVIDDEKTVKAHTVIIATGATARYLGLESEKKFAGQGVSACATCDGFFFRGKTVAVVGGGDTACEEATYLATLAKKVYLIVRRDVFRASDAMQKRVADTKNIEVLWNRNPQEVLGDLTGVTGVRLLNNKTNEVSDLPIDGFFLAIGHHPNSDVFKGQIATNPEGYIITEGKTSKTDIEGVFAAGDVQDPDYRQAVTAAASGCRAALDADRFLACYLPTLEA